MSDVVEINCDDFWVKVVEMLQQNWALIEPVPSGGVYPINHHPLTHREIQQ
jgi:hypothetical protein